MIFHPIFFFLATSTVTTLAIRPAFAPSRVRWNFGGLRDNGETRLHGSDLSISQKAQHTQVEEETFQTIEDYYSHLFKEDGSLRSLALKEAKGILVPEDGLSAEIDKEQAEREAEMQNLAGFNPISSEDDFDDVPDLDWNGSPGDELVSMEDVHVRALDDNSRLMRGCSISIKCGEIHAILGRNGSGKSTLSKTLNGYPNYLVSKGTIKFKGVDITMLPAHVRTQLGMFLAFQAPPELPILTESFLMEICNARAKVLKEPQFTALTFGPYIKPLMKRVGLPVHYLDRNLNEGFSGGERKRCEMLQMMCLKPNLVILDETDSGLDVDSFKLAVEVLRRYKEEEPRRSYLIVTHYKRLLETLQPTKCHVMHKGKIIHVGGPEVPDELEAHGFQPILNAYKKKIEKAKLKRLREGEGDVGKDDD